MITQTFNTEQGVVADLRKIREQISREINGMTFEEERAYLDSLLVEKNKHKHDGNVAEMHN